MLTKEQALTENEFHVWNYRTKRCYNWRRNGQTRTWKRDTERWSLPVKCGLYGYARITNGSTSSIVFVASECPHHPARCHYCHEGFTAERPNDCETAHGVDFHRDCRTNAISI